MQVFVFFSIHSYERNIQKRFIYSFNTHLMQFQCNFTPYLVIETIHLLWEIICNWKKMHDKWWPFWSFHAHFGQIGAICNVCIRSKVFFKYLDKLIGIREGHSYETSFSQVIKRKNFMTPSSTWQQEEDQQQILNSNDMTAGAKLTVKNVYWHLSCQQSTYN